ncbi:MAG: phosphoserine transaminase [Acidimicrobiia bacterium]
MDNTGGVSSSATDLRIPADLLPRDGRFGCGPSKVRPEAVDALAKVSRTFLGTSHRQPTVKSVVGSIRAGLTSLFSLPTGWEVVLGNGGSTVFWDVATFGLIERKSQHLTFGEFSSKFAQAAAAAPHLDDPEVIESAAGTHPQPKPGDGIDTYALTHNETSTGVAMVLERPEGTEGKALVVVDATSGAGGLAWSPEEVDVYYFAPQKCFAADGGLWIALCSPAAIERIEAISASKRWIPGSLDLKQALDNSRLDQTLNTPALATLFLFEDQIRWMNDHGGLAWTSERCATSAGYLYDWADKATYATPFVKEPGQRSTVVGTIDFEGVDANTIAKVLRANGIVDTESYRKLGRNQLRIGMFPAVDPDDVLALTRCIDFVTTNL